ncbi:hypothetical protein [Xaviernesmea oryzae]|uniref:hypothetical protein n=1 Tax=Xaviernesmea oryzae TaxID=464029 RepID=UPI00117AFE0B|nr:hypothetical protein [Xaviernesmea oryzae]
MLVTLNDDATVGVIDPKLNLRSSNMLAAHRLGKMPGASVADAIHMRLLATFPDTGEVRSFSLHSSAETTLLKELARPTAIATAGDTGFWLAEEGKGSISRHTASGQLLETIGLTAPGSAISFRPVAADPAKSRTRNLTHARLGAFAADGTLLLVESETGRKLMRQPAGERIVDAAFLSNGAVLTLAADKPAADLRFADRPQVVQRISTGIIASHLAPAPDGRFVIAYEHGGSIFTVIDVASAQVVQSFQLDAGTISDVLMTADAAFILSHDGGFVVVMDSEALGAGREIILRRVPLAGTSPRPKIRGPFLIPLAPAPMILIVDPARQTGWILPEAAATSEIPPMDSVRLRGGVPNTVLPVDRAFRKLGPGRYEATWAFDAGPQELVLTTGAGGFSRCIPFAVDGDPRRQTSQPVLLQVTLSESDLVSGVPQDLRLSLRDRQGRDRTPDEMELLLPSMVSSWREVITARRGADGALHLSITFPHPGSYTLQPLRLPKGLALQSTPVLEVLR